MFVTTWFCVNGPSQYRKKAHTDTSAITMIFPNVILILVLKLHISAYFMIHTHTHTHTHTHIYTHALTHAHTHTYTVRLWGRLRRFYLNLGYYSYM